MKIKKNSHQRFRSILDLKLELNTENNFQAFVVFTNNSGKTNVLKALNIFSNQMITF